MGTVSVVWGRNLAHLSSQDKGLPLCWRISVAVPFIVKCQLFDRNTWRRHEICVYKIYFRQWAMPKITLVICKKCNTHCHKRLRNRSHVSLPNRWRRYTCSIRRMLLKYRTCLILVFLLGGWVSSNSALAREQVIVKVIKQLRHVRIL